jgi:hypothetical protein
MEIRTGKNLRNYKRNLHRNRGVTIPDGFYRTCLYDDIFDDFENGTREYVYLVVTPLLTNVSILCYPSNLEPYVIVEFSIRGKLTVKKLKQHQLWESSRCVLNCECHPNTNNKHFGDVYDTLSIEIFIQRMEPIIMRVPEIDNMEEIDDYVEELEELEDGVRNDSFVAFLHRRLRPHTIRHFV